MGMKKADLEAHRDAYEAHMRAARSAEASGMFRVAMNEAMNAWQYIDGMMQFERRYQEAEFESIPAIDLVLKYAPLLFHAESLKKLEILLKSYKRIEKQTSADLGDYLNAARDRMWENHRLWSLLQENPEIREDQLGLRLVGDRKYWKSVVDGWEKMELLQRIPDSDSHRLVMTTRLGQLVDAKCAGCGSVQQGPKAMFLEEARCPDCGQNVSFVLLRSIN
jgi:hypothetical protein